MVEGVYTAKMKERPKYAPDILSWVWSGINVFGLIGVGLAGPLIDTVSVIVQTISIHVHTYIHTYTFIPFAFHAYMFGGQGRGMSITIYTFA